MNKPIVAAAAFLALCGVGVWYYLSHREVAPAPVVHAPPPPAPPAEAPIAHPLPDAADAEPAAPLPALSDSDGPFNAALGALIGAAAVTDYVEPDGIIRRIVVTVDNLPRQKVPLDKRPVHGVAGVFHADGDELHATLDTRNFDRYRPLVEVIRRVDMQDLTRVYVHFYPLFQRAYQDLGYPNGYFNDRVVAAIDVLLATPQISGPIDLVRPNVMYLYADPKLEALPAGQKLLIRLGPDNAATLKAKLSELRADLTAAPIKKSAKPQ